MTPRSRRSPVLNRIATRSGGNVAPARAHQGAAAILLFFMG
jgi:hypothetical protein